MLKRSPMKRKAPKKRPKIDGIDYLALCRGQDCYLRLPGVSIHARDTVVPAHSNQSKHGKGMGKKAEDIFTVPACHTCHAEIDQGRKMAKQEKFDAWDAAYARWKIDREKLILGENHE